MNKIREWVDGLNFHCLGLVSLMTGFWCAFAYCFIDSRVMIGALVALVVMLMLDGIFHEREEVLGWKLIILYFVGVAIMIGMARHEGVSIANSIISGIIIPLLPWTAIAGAESFKKEED